MTSTSDVESLLFALGRRTTVEEIARILRVRDNQKVIDALEELKRTYDAKQGPIIVVHADGGWKMTVRDDLLPLVRRVVSKTELPKGVMETLAIIAYKAPVLQSEIVRIRTNKAYDHLALLQEMHFITRDKSGRTKLIKLSKKFFDYFDVPEGDMKARFSNVKALEEAIADKEQEISAVISQQKQAQAQNKVEEDQHKRELEAKHTQIDAELAQLPPINLIDDEGHPEKLEPYESSVVDPEAPAKLAPDVKVIDEIEVYQQAPQPHVKKIKAPAPVVDVLHDEASTPQERAEFVRDTLATDVVEEPEDVAPQGDKFEPESIEYEARKLARETKAEGTSASKGLFSQGMSAEMTKQVDEKVSQITGEHASASHTDDQAHDIPTPDVAVGDVHVTPEAGEKEERKKGGPDPHAHPGNE